MRYASDEGLTRRHSGAYANSTGNEAVCILMLCVAIAFINFLQHSQINYLSETQCCLIIYQILSMIRAYKSLDLFYLAIMIVIIV